MIYLHKILPLFASPLFFSITLLIIYLIIRKKLIFIIGICVILIFSNPLVSEYIKKYVEYPYKPLKIESIKKSDYVVVLSGDTMRFFAGINLFNAGKAKKIIFTAAKLPWDKGKINEGQFYRLFGIVFGIKNDDIILTGKVQNTSEEAFEISKLIPKGSSVILVTSALHMQRASFLFKKYDFKVNPFPIGFNDQTKKLTFMDFIPSSGALHVSSVAIRELQGRLYYYIKENIT